VNYILIGEIKSATMRPTITASFILFSYSGENQEHTMPLEIDDYNEEGVVTPDSWYDAYGGKEKLKEVKDITRYILTFSYLSHFLETMKSQEELQKAQCYPDLYTFNFSRQRIGCVVVPIGAPAACTRLEDLIYMGGNSFIIAGGVGVLSDDIKRGELIIPTGAIRDEGTSYHYIPSDNPVTPSSSLVGKLQEACKMEDAEFHEGKVWTTDAPYRETRTRIKAFREMGAVCVDMEASACFAVAEYRGVSLAALFYGGDYVNEVKWDGRAEGKKHGQAYQSRLFQIACRALTD